MHCLIYVFVSPKPSDFCCAQKAPKKRERKIGKTLRNGRKTSKLRIEGGIWEKKLSDPILCQNIFAIFDCLPVFNVVWGEESVRKPDGSPFFRIMSPKLTLKWAKPALNKHQNQH